METLHLHNFSIVSFFGESMQIRFNLSVTYT
jgi:hypothetical protein